MRPLFNLPALALALAMASAQGADPGASGFHVPDTIAERASACVACHGKQGRASPAGYLPRIAGKPAHYLHQQLLSFRDGRRNNRMMSPLLAQLSDDYLQELADYFAALDLPYPAPRVTAPVASERSRAQTLVLLGDAARGVPACVSCHGAALMGQQPDVPGLLGLPQDYLSAQLGAWRNGQRHARAPDCMDTVARRLDASDIPVIARWLASQTVPAGAHAEPASQALRPIPCAKLQP